MQKLNLLHVMKILAEELPEIRDFKPGFLRELDELGRVDDGMKSRPEGMFARLSGIPVAKDRAIHPDMKPVRRVLRHHSEQGGGIWCGDENQAAGCECGIELPYRLVGCGQVLDDIMTHDEIEAAGREAIGFDVSEYLFVSIMILPKLNVIDVDNRYPVVAEGS